MKIGNRAHRSRYACIACIVLTSCTTVPREDAPRNVGPLHLAPGERHEDCVRLYLGDRMLFRFDAAPAAAFSVRYHSGEALVHPMIRPPTESDSGFFVAAETRTYCFEWVADTTFAGSTRLTYHLSLERRQ